MATVGLTPNQIKILTILVRGNKEQEDQETEHVDIDQLLERLESRYGWKTTKQSIQFSIRALIKRGLLEKGETENRRGKARRILIPTPEAITRVGTRVEFYRDSDGKIHYL